MPIEFRNRNFTFGYVPPYSHICIHGVWKICVPQFHEFLTHVLYSHHDPVTAGHGGQEKSFTALSNDNYWPGMRAYTTAYVQSCTYCRGSKSLNQKPAGLVLQLLIPSRRWAHMSLDCIIDIPLLTTGPDSILVMVDTVRKMPQFVPAKKPFTAADTVELLKDRFIRYHSFSEVLISDLDPRFQSDLWQQLCRRFKIKRAISSSYHPQSEGQTETDNCTLEQMFRANIQSDEREWERLLPALGLAYNTTSHSSTQLSLFGVMIGDNPLTADAVGALSSTLTPPMTKLFR
ncbi:hypothetical protein ENH_00070160 [Eimeria necatrix]|uniref:Integrase catalytic domain-containing protein n=1 Tax=Eimeria necatrix TaxID=51315 RepID=U6MJQ6_9EIME|nr:hypothetical protein ENH_00070160 [Eimeria necatrix]CDJ64467.1 hypothetical protein ENH_00070160 [Eimeria necatrix]